LKDLKQNAKLSVLKHIRGLASNMMKDELPSKMMKKVTVASDSPEGLVEGLKKAKEIVAKDPMEEMMAEHEGEESSEEETTEDDANSEQEDAEESPEMLRAKIKELEAKLAAKA
jgi:hypothetical protein